MPIKYSNTMPRNLLGLDHSCLTYHRQNPLGSLRIPNVAFLILILSLALLSSCGGGGAKTPTGGTEMPPVGGGEMPPVGGGGMPPVSGAAKTCPTIDGEIDPGVYVETVETDVEMSARETANLHTNGNTKDITLYRADNTKLKFTTYREDGVKKITETDYFSDGTTLSRVITYNPRDGVTKDEEIIYEEDDDRHREIHYYENNRKDAEFFWRGTKVLRIKTYYGAGANHIEADQITSFAGPLLLLSNYRPDGTRIERIHYSRDPSYATRRTCFGADGITVIRIITYNSDGSVETTCPIIDENADPGVYVETVETDTEMPARETTNLHTNGNTKDITAYRADNTKLKFTTYQRDGVKKISETDYLSDGIASSRVITYNRDGVTKDAEIIYEARDNERREISYDANNRKDLELSWRGDTISRIKTYYAVGANNLATDQAISRVGTPLLFSSYRPDGTRIVRINYNRFPPRVEKRTCYGIDGKTATRIVTYNPNGSVATDEMP